MKISKLGNGFLKISASLNKKGAVDILINSGNPDELKKLRVKADILLLTRPKPEGIDIFGDYFLIDGPGEYEIKEIFIRGIGILKEKQGPGAIYTIKAEGITVCYFGLMEEKELKEEQIEELGASNVLIIPISENEGLLAKQASIIIHQIEPKIVALIPGKGKKSETELKEFLKEMGEKEQAKTKELNIKEKDLKEEEMKVIVLEST